MSNKQGKRPVDSTKKKATVKKEQLNVEEALSMSEAFVIKFKKHLIAGVSIIVVFVAAYLLYENYVSGPQNKAAAEAIFYAESYFDQQDFEKALNGDSLGNLGFIDIANEYSGTPSGNLANAYAGISLVQLKRYEEAIDYLKDFEGDDIMVAPAVLGALGSCYAQLDDLDNALKYFLAAAKKADNNAISPNFLLQAGNIYEQQGKKADALKVYTEIKDKYFNSYQALDIEKYIERVK